MNEFQKKYQQEIDAILKRYPPDQKRSAVMPLLFLAQRESNFIKEEDIDEIANLLDISSTHVSSIIGFYTLFHLEQGGRYRIQMCTDLPCALQGAEKFLKELCEFLSIGVGETTSDGLFTIEEVKCLAACNCAPMFQVQGDGEITYHENQNLDTAKLVIKSLRERAASQVKPDVEEERT